VKFVSGAGEDAKGQEQAGVVEGEKINVNIQAKDSSPRV